MPVFDKQAAEKCCEESEAIAKVYEKLKRLPTYTVRFSPKAAPAVNAHWHYSENSHVTLCFRQITEKWIIESTDGEGEATCPRCIKAWNTRTQGGGE